MGRLAKIRNMPWRVIVATLPILLVNAVSIFGQTVYWYSHIFNLAGSIAFAVALESIAVYLAYHAHLAQLSNDASLRLRWASYLFGALIGLLNGSHWLNNGQITAAAVGMCLLSASSPWLWAVHTRRESRDILRESGLIDDHAVRLGGNRTFWHPVMSAKVMSHAAWTGENNPAAAIAAWETSRAARQAATVAPEPRLTLENAASQADAVRVALRDMPGADSASASTVSGWLSERGHPGIAAGYIRAIRSAGNRQSALQPPDNVRALPNPETGSADRSENTS